MASLLDAATRVHERLFRPNEQQLPFADVWAAVRMAWTGMLVDLRISDAEYATRETFFVPGANVRFPVPAEDFAFPVRMEALEHPNELTSGVAIPLVAVQNLSEERRIGRLSYALVGWEDGHPVVEFSFPIERYVRFVYEPDTVLYPKTDERLDILNMFIDYLVVRAAIMLLPRLVMPTVNLSVLQETLLLDKMEWEKRWEHYLHGRSPIGAKTMRPAGAFLFGRGYWHYGR